MRSILSRLAACLAMLSTAALAQPVFINDIHLDLRYEGGGDEPDLLLVPGVGEDGPRLGQLCTLLDWHRGDPVDRFERRRNGVIAREQGNRNPFVDHPEWVDELWGGDCR